MDTTLLSTIAIPGQPYTTRLTHSFTITYHTLPLARHPSRNIKRENSKRKLKDSQKPLALQTADSTRNSLLRTLIIGKLIIGNLIIGTRRHTLINPAQTTKKAT